MLVTKATSKTSLGQEIGTQFSARSGPLKLGALIIGGLGFVPGLPTFPFLALGSGLLFIAARMKPTVADSGTATPDSKSADPRTATAGPTLPALDAADFVQIERIAVEVGARLVPLVDNRRGPSLLDRIAGLRKDLSRQQGIWVPTIRVRDNMSLDADSYRILVLGREVGRGKLKTDSWLAIDSGSTRFAVDGEETTEPTFGLPARWIPETERHRAELAGYTVVDTSSVIITHLGEIVTRHAHELLGRDDLKLLLDKVRESSPAVVDELLPNMLSTGILHRVLMLLIEERVPINHLPRVLESLANHAMATKDAAELAERARTDLGRAICDRFRDSRGRLSAIVMDPRLEVELRRCMTEQKQLAIDPTRLEQLVMRLGMEKRKATARGVEVALLCDAGIRRPLRHTLARSLPDLGIVAYQEIPTDVLMEPVVLVKPEDLSQPLSQAA